MDSGYAQGAAERRHQADRQSLPSAGVPGQDRSDPQSRACSQPSSAQDHLHPFQVRLHLPFLGHRESQKLHLPPWAHCPVRETESGGGRGHPGKRDLGGKGSQDLRALSLLGMLVGMLVATRCGLRQALLRWPEQPPHGHLGPGDNRQGGQGRGLWRRGQHSSHLRAGPLPSFQQASHQEIHAGVAKSAVCKKPENAPPLQRIYILVQIQIP